MERLMKEKDALEALIAEAEELKRQEEEKLKQDEESDSEEEEEGSGDEEKEEKKEEENEEVEEQSKDEDTAEIREAKADIEDVSMTVGLQQTKLIELMAANGLDLFQVAQDHGITIHQLLEWGGGRLPSIYF